MQQVADWLEKIGLGQHAQRFAENDISFAVLPDLTDQHLKEMGVSLGHRLQLLRAIAELTSRAKEAPKAAVATASAAALEDTAERRQVSVMFSDLVGSTALSARMDPEDLREVISAYQKCVAETVQRFGGFVAKYMGDGVLIYFGYPQAHEDDAERAVRAGLDLVQAVGGLKSNPPLETRVGIATGLVVVGDLIGSGEAQERGIVGETPNLAARLQGLAEPNVVVIAESTRKLLGNLFDLQDLGAKELKGMGGPVKAWAVLRSSQVESRFEALHASGLTELVGREEELEILLRRWSKAKTGEGQVVLLSGEAGIGKSRITAAVLERIIEPHSCLRYFCSPQHTDSALFPIISQMERAAGIAHGDTAQVKLDKFDALLAQTSTDEKDAALIAEMLSLANDGRYPAPELTPEQRRQRTLEALISQAHALTRSKPVLMIVEDAHWTDPTSLEVFSRIVDRIATLRMLVIVTFRPEFEPPWVGRPNVTVLTLNRLTRREIGAIIDGVVGNRSIPVGIWQDIVERTDGIPLFVEEMTKAVLEAESEGEARRTAAAVPSAGRAVPASLQASLMARLDRLGPAKEVAQIGAAIGREFSHVLLSAVASKPEPKLASALDRLTDAGLLFRQGVPPHATYLFKHALVRDAAYGTLLRGRRQQIHVNIATTLKNQFPEIVETQPETLAQHYALAGLAEKAVGFWLKAGHQAMKRSAMLEAEALLSRGLDLVAGLAEDTERQQHELDLRSALIVTLMQTKGYAAPAVAENLARARQLCEQLKQPPQCANVLYVQCGYRILRGELPLACQNAKEHLELGEARNDPAVKATACFNSAVAWFYRGDFAAARAYSERVLELYDTAHSSLYATISPQDPQLGALIVLSYVLLCLGHLDQARLRRDEALLKARQCAHAATLALVLVHAWNHDAGVQAEPVLLLQRAEELRAHCAEYGLPYFAAIASVYRGSALSMLGSAEEGSALLTEGVATYRATGALLYVPIFLQLLADCHRRAGQPKEALKYLDEAAHKAARQIEATDEHYTAAEIHRLRGALLIAVGDPIAAEVSFRQAIAVACRQNAKLWELRAAMSMARLWRDQGKRDEARELLAPVYGWFTEGFDTRDLKEAKALLEELAA
jgi:class 3 adenylate cyclase/predicted ATPase